MKVLVTGARGQLSRSLVERAAGRPGIEMIAVGRPELDLEVTGSVERVVAEIAPEVIVNAAAYTAVDQAEIEPERAFRVNAEAAGELAFAARRIDSPIVAISTDYVFDGSAACPYDETASPNPLNVYGRSKLLGEEQVRLANPRHLILRASWIYSPFGQNFAKSMISLAKDRDELRVIDDQRGAPTSALDLAEGILVALDRWRADGLESLVGTYHLAGGEVTSWYGFAAGIMDECRKRNLPSAEVRPIATSEWPAKAARPANSMLDSRKFKRDFGYSARPWKPSLAEMFARLVSPE